MDRGDVHGRRQPQRQGLRHAVKIVACGAMSGTAILYPLANVEGLWLRAVTLSIFILSALGFHALHLEPFIAFGPFTAAAALFLLLVAVLAAGSARQELIPWLPLFIASLSLITVVIYDISQRMGPRPLSNAELEDLAGVSIDARSDGSLRTVSTQQRPLRPPESNRLDSLYFDRHGPPSRASHRTGTNVTEISLSGVEGQCRPQWDAQTRSYFQETTLPEQENPEEPFIRSASPDAQGDSDPDSDLDSDHGTVESSHPLLGHQ